MSNSEPDSADLTGRRVLVVEDEYFIADDLAKALRTLGAEVVGPVARQDDARRLLESGQAIHLAVLDINLQDQMIYPVADALAERGVPYLFATGYGAETIPSAYRHVPRWEKPFDPEKLAPAASGLLRS